MNTNGTDVGSPELIVVVAVGVLATGRLRPCDHPVRPSRHRFRRPDPGHRLLGSGQLPAQQRAVHPRRYPTARRAVGALISLSLAQAAIAACAVSVAVIGTRLLWFYSVPYTVRFLDRRPQQRDRRITAPQRLPRAWAGMRGAISPAAALTVPAVTAEGHVVEQRDAVGPPLPGPFDAVRACGASNPPCFRSSGTRSGTCATPAASDRVPRRGKTQGLVSGRRRGRSSAGRWSTRRARRA